MNTVENAKSISIPTLNTIALESLLQTAVEHGWKEIHLIGPHCRLNDEAIIDYLNRANGGEVDRNSIYKVCENCGLDRLRAVTTLRRASVIGFRLQSPEWRFLVDLKGLRSLDVQNNAIDDVSLKNLATLLELEILNLSNNCIDGGGLRHLEKLKKLTRLVLAGNSVKGSHLNHLTGLRRMTSLILQRNQIDDVGMHILANPSVLKSLKELSFLDVTGNRIPCIEDAFLGTRDARSILATVLAGKCLPRLRILIVGGSKVGKTWLRRRCFQKQVLNSMERWTPTEGVEHIPPEQCQIDFKDYLETDAPAIETTVLEFGSQVTEDGVYRGIFPEPDERTVILLVLSSQDFPCSQSPTKAASKVNRVDTWLMSLRRFYGTETPIVIAVTQCDVTARQDEPAAEQTRPIDAPVIWLEGTEAKPLKDVQLDWLKQRFGANVVRVVDHCSATNPGAEEQINRLRKAIAVAMAEHTKVLTARVPEEYRGFAERINREFFKRTSASLQEYEAWCDSDDVNVADPAIRKTYLRLLHSHGYVTNLNNSDLDDIHGFMLPESIQRPFALTRRNRKHHLHQTLVHPQWLNRSAVLIISGFRSTIWLSDGKQVESAVKQASQQFKGLLKSHDEANLVLEYLDHLELCCFDAAKAEYFFPRGLPIAKRGDFLKSKHWPLCTLHWDYLPPPNFLRLIVSLHLVMLQSPQAASSQPYRFQHGRNWLRICDPAGSGAEAVVVASFNDGAIEVRFDPEQPGTLEGRQRLLELVKVRIEYYQLGPSDHEPELPKIQMTFSWPEAILDSAETSAPTSEVDSALSTSKEAMSEVTRLNENTSADPPLDFLKEYYKIAILFEKMAPTTQAKVAAEYKMSVSTVSRTIKKIATFWQLRWQLPKPPELLDQDKPGAAKSRLSSIGLDVMEWIEKVIPELRSHRKND